MDCKTLIVFLFAIVTGKLSFACLPSGRDEEEDYLEEVSDILCELSSWSFCRSEEERRGLPLMIVVVLDNHFDEKPFTRIIARLDEISPRIGRYEFQHDDLRFFLGEWVIAAEVNLEGFLTSESMGRKH